MSIERPEWWSKAWAVPPRSLRLRDWSERHVVVLQGARKGPFRLAANPMLGPLMDVYEHPAVRETATMKGVQTGVSQVAQNYVAKKAHTDPCQILLVLPSKEAGRQQVKKRWKPMLSGKGCPVLKQYQRRRRTALGRPMKKAGKAAARIEEDTDRTTYENIVLTNNFDLILGYSGSVQSLASNSCQDVILDEVDKYNDWESKETSPRQLAKARTETFQEIYKIHEVSTPTLDTEQIAVDFENSDIKLYPFIACPGCGKPVQMLFDNIVWALPEKKELPNEKERAKLLLREPHRVWIECGDCHARIDEQGRLDGLANGWLGTQDQAWVFHADGREAGVKPWGTSVGIHFPTMASTMGIGIVAMAAEWIEAQGNLAKVKYCKTQHHGVPFVSDLIKPAKGLLWKKCRDDEERGFRAPPGMKVPPWASRLFLLIDTQKDKFYWLIRAYGRGRRSRKMANGEARSFEDLERLLYAKWENEDPALPARSVFLAAIDSGGGIDRKNEDATRTEQVYRWCAADPQRRLALKGVTSNKYDTLTKLRYIEYQSPKNGDVIRVHLMWVKPLDSGDNLASTMQQTIDLFDPETGELTDRKADLWELDRDTTNEYIRHVEVMQRKQKRKNGKTVSVWEEEVEGARHDYHDLERYAEALSHDATIGCEALPSEAELRSRAAVATQQQTTVARPTAGVTMPDGRPFLANRR